MFLELTGLVFCLTLENSTRPPVEQGPTRVGEHSSGVENWMLEMQRSSGILESIVFVYLSPFCPGGGVGGAHLSRVSGGLQVSRDNLARFALLSSAIDCFVSLVCGVCHSARMCASAAKP